MIYKVTIHREVMVNTDDDLPVGTMDDFGNEECDCIWEAVSNESFLEDECIEKVEVW